MKKDFMIGSDPELIVEHGDGSLFPSFEFLPSKAEPLEVAPGQFAYDDGIQAECSIIPHTSIEKVVSSIRDGYKGILGAARKKDPTARLSAKPVVEVDLDWLATLPPEKVEFGCMPSFNIWQVAGMGIEGSQCGFRFGGGHIHMGTGPLREDKEERVIKSLDRILGVACVSLFENIDQADRRKFYGLVGEFRRPPHGIEYRTLSNAWTYHPKLAETVLDLSRQVVNFALSDYGDRWQAEDFEVIETVLLSDIDKARGMLERNADLFKKFRIKNGIDFMKPAEQQLNMTDIAANWKI